MFSASEALKQKRVLAHQPRSRLLPAGQVQRGQVLPRRQIPPAGWGA